MPNESSTELIVPAGASSFSVHMVRDRLGDYPRRTFSVYDLTLATLDYLRFVLSSDSPIEQQMAAYAAMRVFGIDREHARDDLRHLDGYANLVLVSQPALSVDGQTIHPDFCFCATGPLRRPASLLIECDGHDYHDRTKEQAARDRQRDRVLTRNGWRVVRFTGLELWHDADGCAREALHILESLGGWQGGELTPPVPVKTLQIGMREMYKVAASCGLPPDALNVPPGFAW